MGWVLRRESKIEFGGPTASYGTEGNTEQVVIARAVPRPVPKLGCVPQKIDPALIARSRPAMFGCFWPIFFFAEHRNTAYAIVTTLLALLGLVGLLAVVSKNTNERKAGASRPFRSSSTRGEPQIWGSEAMSAIRVPRTRRENTVQQGDATLPSGNLGPGPGRTWTRTC